MNWDKNDRKSLIINIIGGLIIGIPLFTIFYLPKDISYSSVKDFYLSKNIIFQIIYVLWFLYFIYFIIRTIIKLLKKVYKSRAILKTKKRI